MLFLDLAFFLVRGYRVFLQFASITGKCVVPGLSDFFQKSNLVFGVRVGNSGVFGVRGGNGVGDAGRQSGVV